MLLFITGTLPVTECGLVGHTHKAWPVQGACIHVCSTWHPGVPGSSYPGGQVATDLSTSWCLHSQNLKHYYSDKFKQ